MSESRIQIAKDKISFVNKLTDPIEDLYLFNSKADCLTFAAGYGYSRDRKVPLNAIAPDPIRYDIFERNRYDTFFHLLAMEEKKDAHVLGDSEEKMQLRARIFEEYANGGLEILQEELKGSVDSLDSILAILQKQIKINMGEGEEDLGFNFEDLRI